MLAPVFSIPALGLTAGKVLYSDGTSLLSAAAVAYATTGTHLTVTANAISVVPLAVQAFSAGQTANLLEARNSVGTVLSAVTPEGYFYGPTGTARISTTGNIYLEVQGSAETVYCSGNLKAQYGSTYGYIASGAGLFLLRDFTYGLVLSAGSDTPDIGVARSAAGILKVTGGYSGFGSLIVGAYTAAAVGLTVKGAASQTANALEIQNSSGTVLLAVNAAGSLYGPTGNVTFDAAASGTDTFYWKRGGSQIARLEYNGNFIVTNELRGTIYGFTGGTADIGIARASAGVVKITDSSTGFGKLLAAVLAVNKNTVPADATIAAGEAVCWFDSTNLLSKFMVKAKTADGTVVTGSLPLA